MHPPLNLTQNRNLPRALIEKLQRLDPAFSINEARLAGISEWTLRRRGIHTPAPGIYVNPYRFKNLYQRDAERKTHAEVAKRYSFKMAKNSFYTMHTAAALWGLPIRVGADDALSIGYLHPTKFHLSPQFIKQTLRSSAITLEKRHGTNLTSPACTWVMLAATLPRRDAVAIADAIVRIERMPRTNRIVRPALASVGDLKEQVETKMRRNKPELRKLLRAVSTRSASVPETHLRLLLSDHAIAPTAEDFDVYDTTGRFLGCSELAYPEHKVAVEYEGDHHRVERDQWNRDIEKYRDYQDAGWRVIRVTAEMLYRDPTRLVGTVKRALSS